MWQWRAHSHLPIQNEEKLEFSLMKKVAANASIKRHFTVNGASLFLNKDDGHSYQDDYLPAHLMWRK
jgi:hypothetical protein